MADDATVQQVSALVARTLGIEDRLAEMDASTGLFGSLPELDSLAVLELVQALEDDLGLTIEDEEFSGELFETVGSLADFVESKRLSV
ncbi:acyl carrier protein [Microlunatus capsulatus]|uniref:Acyl carrier protein n=1 Tax=Microlunatus capsulatus TaxID=99117 RepID=A0ABS4ZBX2_9ACTN|nr:acyl carrier protein [Microlunatus capsulatus]MBP2418556.1 acyl carrier protein [Microlunatus capsulatus]